MRNRLLAVSAVIAVGSLANADVLINQLDFAFGTQLIAGASQDFEPAEDPLDVIAVDDFTVTAAQTLIFNVEVMLNGWGGFNASKYTDGSIQGYRVEFYTSLAAAATSMTGNAGSAFVSTGAATVNLQGWGVPLASAAHVVLPVNVLLPGPGTYWFGVAAIMDFSPHGQVGVQSTSLVLGNQNGDLVNAAAGWGFPGNIFGGVPDINGNPVPLDLEYKIEGVPEPASMIALGLGVTALLARRRKKA